MGGGGTGKSVVSAELLRRLRARGDAGLAWHFCRHDDAAQSSASALIRSLSAMLGAAVGDAAKFREAREAAAARASDDASTAQPPRRRIGAPWLSGSPYGAAH